MCEGENRCCHQKLEAQARRNGRAIFKQPFAANLTVKIAVCVRFSMVKPQRWSMQTILPGKEPLRKLLRSIADREICILLDFCGFLE